MECLVGVGYTSQLSYVSTFNCLSTINCKSTSTDINEVGISTINKGGRLPGIYKYELVEHGGKSYAVISIDHKKTEIRFVIDTFNLTMVLNRPWHLSSGKYIATNYQLENGKNKELYLHNFIKEYCMNISDKSIIHINNNMLDNRSENLRIIDPNDYISQKTTRKRSVILPPNCGFTIEDIPKYVSFTKGSGEHGDRFVIEIPKLNILRKLSCSKKISIEDKFKEAKQLLNEIYISYPELNPNTDEQVKIELNKSLEIILSKV